MNQNENLFLSRSHSTDPEIRASVASDPECPSEILARLLDDSTNQVAEGAFLNPSLPVTTRNEVWATAADDVSSPARQLLWRLANRANPPEGIHDRLLRVAVRNSRPERTPQNQTMEFLAILKYPSCPEKWVRQAVISGTGLMRVSAASNPNLTSDLVITLIHKGYFLYLLELNPAGRRLMRDVIPLLSMHELVKLPEQLENEQIDRISEDRRRDMKGEPELLKLCVDRLSTLMERPDESVTARVLADRLAADLFVAEFTTSPEQVTALCNHRLDSVRELAASNPVASDADKVLVALLRLTTSPPK